MYSIYEGLQLFGHYDHFHGCGEFIFRKENPNDNPHFDIYLQERQKEIDRLEKIVEQQTSYADKLKCFLENRAGQLMFDELRIYTNEMEKHLAANDTPSPQWYTKTNLSPSAPDERKVFNDYLRSYVEQLIVNPEKFQWLVEVKYKGFLVSPALQAFKKQMQKAFTSVSALTTEIKRVEDKFYANSITNYIENLYPYEVKNIAFWKIALFNAFLNGHEFDYSRKQLSEHEMQAIIHVEQALEYFKQLHELKDTVSRQRKPAVETLTPEQVRAKFISQFERELEFGKIPFVDLINKEPAFKVELLNEYLTAEMKPCFAFFRAEHYSEEEMNDGWADAHNKIPVSTGKGIIAASLVAITSFESHLQDLGQEFDEMVGNKTLPAKYYCPNIEKNGYCASIERS